MTNKQVIVGDEQAISPEGSGVPLVQGTTETPVERSGHLSAEDAAFVKELGGYIEHGLCYGISSRDGRTCARTLLLHFNITPRGAETSAVSGDRTEADANSAGSVNQAISPEAESSLPLPSASDDLVMQYAKCCHGIDHRDCEQCSRSLPLDGEASLRAQLAAANDEARNDIEIKRRFYDDIQSLQARLATATKALEAVLVVDVHGWAVAPMSYPLRKQLEEALHSLTDGAKPCR